LIWKRIIEGKPSKFLNRDGQRLFVGVADILYHYPSPRSKPRRAACQSSDRNKALDQPIQPTLAQNQTKSHIRRSNNPRAYHHPAYTPSRHQPVHTKPFDILFPYAGVQQELYKALK